MNFIDLLSTPDLCLEPNGVADLARRAESGQGLPLGQYAKLGRIGGDVLIARDPLGCAKVFYGRGGTGDLVVSNRIARLVGRGVPLTDIVACPPGRVVRLGADGRRALAGVPARYTTPETAFDAEDLQARVRERLAAAFMLLAKRHRGAHFVVCLSGGSDSSIIAGFAAKYLPGAICCSFSFRAAGGQGDTASDDFRAAARVAERLDMPLLPVWRTSDAVRDSLSHAVGLCQDWRDF